jgi:hypothetical protein
MEGNEKNDNARMNKTAICVILAACVLGIIVIGALVPTGGKSDGFSELYFEDPKLLPSTVDVGDTIDFAFTVVSHEKNPTAYYYNVTYDRQVIQSGNISIEPYISDSKPSDFGMPNEKTIEINMSLNESSLKQVSIKPSTTVSRLTYNGLMGTIGVQGTGPERTSIISSPRGYTVILWGPNNTTKQVDVGLSGTSDKFLIPIKGASGETKLIILDPSKEESYRTNFSTMTQVGTPDKIVPSDSKSLSDYGYKISREEWIVNNNRGYVDSLQRNIVTNYRYALKKISVEVASMDSEIIGSNETAIDRSAIGEASPLSEYEIHFWVIVMESPEKLSAL